MFTMMAWVLEQNTSCNRSMNSGMYKNKKVLGIIPARGGSKGIAQKNIRPLLGKPLIYWTIEAAQKSAFLTRCIVSTDDVQIAELSRAAGAEVPFMRPDEISQDRSTAIEFMQHAVTSLADLDDISYDYVMVLQPTSPLRTSEDIDACIEMIVDSGADSVMSMYELTDMSLAKLKYIENGVITSAVSNEGTASARRQDAEPIYKRNCAIYLTRTDLVMEGDIFGADSRAYVMPEDRSVDINEPIDFEFASFLLKRNENN